MKKIRIGMFSWESLYSIRVGGISPHVSELSEALAAEGHEVHLFTRGREHNDDIINGVHYHRVACDQNGGDSGADEQDVRQHVPPVPRRKGKSR